MLKHLAHLIPEAILRNCRVVPRATLPTGLFHISANPALGEMIPQIPKRVLRTEDFTFPRICVSSSLVGCIFGHSGTLADYAKNKPVGRDWLGGYAIYALDFDVALRPNRALLSDVDVSDEYWLFNGGWRDRYIPRRVGECFISDIELEPISIGKARKTAISKTPTFWMEVTQDGFPVWLDGSSSLLIKAGHYKFSILDYNYSKGVVEGRDITVEKVTYEDYLRAKGMSLVLLSHDSARSYEW